MIRYPVTFDTQVTTGCGMATIWEIHSKENQSRCAIPLEFEGPGGAFSPEDLFAQSLTNCFVATFQVMAEKSRVTFKTLEVLGHLVVDRDESKHPVMKEFQLKIRLAAPSDYERAKSLVKKAVETGFILNSVKTSITYELVVEREGE